MFTTTRIELDGLSLVIEGQQVQAVYVQTTDDTEETRLQNAAKVAALLGLDYVTHWPEGASMDLIPVSSIC